MKLDWSRTRTVVTGGAGFLGRVVCDVLADRGCTDVFAPRSKDFDLTRERDVERLYAERSPDVVLHLAAEVGGIGANMRHPGRFFYANMAMGLHLIEHARRAGLKRFVQVGTVCAYPRLAPIPFREDDVWNGYPEETNAPYGVAKKALFVMLDAYHAEYGLSSAVVIPVNLYGPHDDFDEATSHVIPALIKKFVDAGEAGQDTVTCWGTGRASREFLYVEDAAEGIVRAAETLERPLPVNLGTGKEISIRELAELIGDLCGFRGRIVWDETKPDGQPRRCLDISRARELLGWSPGVELRDGLSRTVAWYREHRAELLGARPQ